MQLDYYYNKSQRVGFQRCEESYHRYYWSEAPIVMRFLTYFRFWKDRERLSVRDNYKPDLDLSGP